MKGTAVNFIEAVKLIYANPAGPSAVAVRRPTDKSIVFYDRSLFLGQTEFGLRWALGRDGEAHAYSPTFEDVTADDWEVAPDA
jgi:hypothetical protein